MPAARTMAVMLSFSISIPYFIAPFMPDSGFLVRRTLLSRPNVIYARVRLTHQDYTL
jgi:hypothetical protein